MAQLHISLFGKFSVRYHNNDLMDHLGQKSQELIAYLSLHRNKMLSREALASLLWNGECTTAQSRKYLRKTLWKMQRGFQDDSEVLLGRLLHIDNEWIQFNKIEELDLDIHTFEEAFSGVQGIDGALLNENQVTTLERAVAMHQDGLLLNMYVDWCLEARERFQWIYLALLDKLTQYYRHQGNYDRAIDLARRVLHIDDVRECTHRILMELYHKSGDRTSALRQFALCERKLKEEFNTTPSQATQTLFKRIEEASEAVPGFDNQAMLTGLTAIASNRDAFKRNMVDVHKQLQNVLQQVEQMMMVFDVQSETGISEKNLQIHQKRRAGDSSRDEPGYCLPVC